MKLTFTREETDGKRWLTVEWQKPEADNSKFNTACLLVGIYIVGSGILQFVGIITR